jgi:predicted nucleic acid-binding protein
MLTDTNFWIHLQEERQRGEVGPAGAFLARHRAADLKVSIITWGELAPGFDDVAFLERLLHRVKVLYVPVQVAWEAGRIENELAQRGGRLGENDNWIAATARVWGLRLVTRDLAFARVRALRVVHY